LARKIAAAKKEAAKARAGKNSFPPDPLPFCPPEWKSFLLCRAKRGNQNSKSGFSSKNVRILSKRYRQVLHFEKTGLVV